MILFVSLLYNKQIIGTMNSEIKKIRIYNPCIVKIYKGVPIKDNNYKKYQEMDLNDLQKLIKHQNEQKHHYRQVV